MPAMFADRLQFAGCALGCEGVWEAEHGMTECVRKERGQAPHFPDML